MSISKLKILYKDLTVFSTWNLQGEETRPEVLLEKVYDAFNHGSGQEDELFLQLHCRSLSVGDFVMVEDQWYQCASCGWDKVSEPYVERWKELFNARLAQWPVSQRNKSLLLTVSNQVEEIMD